MTRPAQSALLSDPAEIQRQFPVLSREGLHYLDSAATAQMPHCVIAALQRFGSTLARQCLWRCLQARHRGARRI